jgi:hydroxymethylpyrimidine kinase/phosphomethylpyrimidine kinase/thiamine-phosphate diphosphorylase
MDGPLPHGEAWACLLEAGDVLMASSADLLRWLAGRAGAARAPDVGAVPAHAPALADAWRSVKSRLWPAGTPAPGACLRQLPAAEPAPRHAGSPADGGAKDGLQWLDSAQAQGWLSPDPALRAAWQRDPESCALMQAGATALALAKGFVAADAITLGLMLDASGQRCPLPRLSWSAVPAFGPDDATTQHGARHPLGHPAGMPEGPGIYAIVDTAERLARCAEHGAQIVQLRTKLPAHPTPKDQAALRQAIATSIAAAHAAGACLFINDHRQAALDLGASGLHLGQEDLLALTEMQRTALRQPRQHAEGGRLLAVDWAREDGKAGKAGQDGKGSEGGLQLLRLGISSHSVWELARARALAPDYIACGPVWATTTKDMPWRPQGLRNLRWWVANAGCPVVAIGGILDAGHIRDTAACGVAAVCVVRGLGDDPAQTLPALQQALAEGHARARPPVPALPHPSLPSGFGVPDARIE